MEKTILLIYILGFAVNVYSDENKKFSLKNECYQTLTILSQTLLDLQISDSKDQNFGALKCPECDILHTRAAEAVFPFAIMFKQTGDRKYLKAAIRVVNWLIQQQLAEGEWQETPWEWTGTTADQLLMIVFAYPIIDRHLSETEREQWNDSIKKAADYLVKNMSPDFASINYCPTSAAALMKTYKLIPDEQYRRKAQNLARWTVAKMNDEGFIEGEAARVLGVKYGIDLGYEMDMSLWGLALYAKENNDSFVYEKVKNSLAKNLYFVYPNGAIDGSWGSRCYKWTTYGSKTADGCQILFSMFCDEDSRYRTAAIRNLQYLRSMINDGMIGNGPHFWQLFDIKPCNYPTFARAKNLAMAMEFGDQKAGEMLPLPADESGWLKVYPTVNLAIARSENFMVTVSAYGYKDFLNWGEGKYTHHPSGGSVCNLWLKHHGFLQTSSQTKYVRGEVMHMPVVKDSLFCLTPRIEFTNADGYFTNLYECEGQFSAYEGGQAIAVISTTGELKNEKYYQGGVAYIWTHKLFDDAIEKSVTLRFHDRKPIVNIVEPMVQESGMRFVLTDDHTVEIEGGKRNIEFTMTDGDAKIELGQNAAQYWFPFPALKCYPVRLKVEPPTQGFIQNITYRITVVN